MSTATPHASTAPSPQLVVAPSAPLVTARPVLMAQAVVSPVAAKPAAAAVPPEKKDEQCTEEKDKTADKKDDEDGCAVVADAGGYNPVWWLAALPVLALAGGGGGDDALRLSGPKRLSLPVDQDAVVADFNSNYSHTVFSIVSGNDKGFFAIDPDTGELSVKAEPQPDCVDEKFTLTIRASRRNEIDEKTIVITMTAPAEGDAVTVGSRMSVAEFAQFDPIAGENGGYRAVLDDDRTDDSVLRIALAENDAFAMFRQPDGDVFFTPFESLTVPGVPPFKAYFEVAGADYVVFDKEAGYLEDTYGYAKDGVYFKLAAADVVPEGRAGCNLIVLAKETGNSSLTGGDGSDILISMANVENAKNTLAGGKGNDLLFGGVGKDTFEFTDAGPAHVDTIVGFDTANDQILYDSDDVLAKLSGNAEHGYRIAPKDDFYELFVNDVMFAKVYTAGDVFPFPVIPPV